MSLFLEKRCTVLFGGLLVIVYFSVPRIRDYVLPETLPVLLSAVVTVAAIAVGFLATAKSILIAADDRPIIHRIKEAGFYNRIIGYFRSAIAWSFALSIASAVPLIFDYKGLKEWDWPHAYGTALWLFIAGGALASYVRLSRIWYTLLAHLDAKSV
jgi:hypothetical protein